jgi:2-iminobutanoate/2-iminopropanoate deaminase
MKEPVKTSSAPSPAGPYSQAIVAGGFIFVSGQRPADPETGHIPDGVSAQTHQVMKNIQAVLQAAGSDLHDVVRVTTYLANIAGFDEYNGVYAQYFHEPYPARTTVGAQLRGIAVEIDVIALRDAGAQ